MTRCACTESVFGMALNIGTSNCSIMRHSMYLSEEERFTTAASFRGADASWLLICTFPNSHFPGSKRLSVLFQSI